MRKVQELVDNSEDVARPFWAAMLEGHIDIPLCRSCDKPFFFPRRYCPRCHSVDIGWLRCSGEGVVFAITVAHLPFPGIDHDDLPCATGFVDLAEGVRLPARFSIEALPAVGDTVVCRFDQATGFPVFVPEGSEQGT